MVADFARSVVMVVASVMMIVMVVRVPVIGAWRRGRDRERVSVPVRLIMSRVCGSEALQFPEQPAPLRPAEAHSDRDDDEIARDLDHPDGTAPRGGGCAEHCGRDADHCDRGERLQERRGKRQHDAVPPRLAVGDEIGR
jgi:hypothetical protein